MLKEVVKVPNGDTFNELAVYSCDRCGEEYDESHPHTKDHCWKCSYIEGTITEKEYLSCCGIALSNMKATVIDGDVVIWTGKKSPWDKTDKDLRNTKIYKNWRKRVFERDNYTCQDCGQRGGDLNAHHIKSYAKHKKLRHEIDNGLTLCIDCHREVHKKSG